MSSYQNKHFTCELNLKSLSEEGRFAGYASVFGIVDNQKDVILPGAFAKSLAGRESRVKLLWQHQMDEPIGVIERIFEDAKGLYVEGRLLLNVARAREAYDLVRSGALEGMSIGYKPVDYDFDSETGVRRIKEVALYEISLVTFPANAAANITVVKSGEQPLWLELTESIDRALQALEA